MQNVCVRVCEMIGVCVPVKFHHLQICEFGAGRRTVAGPPPSLPSHGRRPLRPPPSLRLPGPRVSEEKLQGRCCELVYYGGIFSILLFTFLMSLQMAAIWRVTL